MSNATAGMSLQESCMDATRHLSVEVHLLASKADELERENAKLRELVKALLQCHVEDTATCAKCSCRSPLHGGCMADVNADELGVEVVR